MSIREHMTVGRIVVDQPAARDVFDRNGIDWCCGGDRPLNRAVAGDKLEQVLAELNSLPSSGDTGSVPQRVDWTSRPLGELIGHIVARHHAYLRDTLPSISILLERVRQAHAERHGRRLAEMVATFAALRGELEAHLAKEEQVLFPAIRRLESPGEGTGPSFPPAMLSHPVGQMKHEHDSAGQALVTLRRLSNDYLPPADACPSFRALYQELARLEDDLHEHIHLENNILFPRALELAARTASDD